MKKGFRICIKLRFGGYGLISGYEKLEDALFEFKKAGKHNNRPFVIMNENNVILYDGENFKEDELSSKITPYANL